VVVELVGEAYRAAWPVVDEDKASNYVPPDDGGDAGKRQRGRIRQLVRDAGRRVKGREAKRRDAERTNNLLVDRTARRAGVDQCFPRYGVGRLRAWK